MISIIIPTHNSEQTINRCINSILLLKNVKYEILLIDDGSTDRTAKINMKYSLKYNEIRAFFQKNKGVSSARNLGLKHARGNWICFIDSDDYIYAKIFSHVLTTCLSSNITMVISNIYFHNKYEGIHYNDIKRFTSKSLAKYYYPLYGNEIIHVVWNKIYNCKIIKKYKIRFDSHMNIGEDLKFNLDYLLHISKGIIQIGVNYYSYNTHNNSITNSYVTNVINDQKNVLDVINIIYNKYKLSKKVMDNLKMKSIRSILMNSLKYYRTNYIFVGNVREEINRTNLKHINIRNLNLENVIIFLIFKQPSRILLFIFLYLVKQLKVHKLF